MPLPTVIELCEALGRDLHPANSFSATAAEISAVHVSELTDPTSYLSGAELLLTTGLSLPDNAIGCDSYVSLLKRASVSALGLGLGPSHQTTPTHLVDACRKHDLCLLIVPPEAAFLTVTKAYWAARSRGAEQELFDAISAHRSLVNAMVSSDPVGEVLRTLARSVGAWAAKLDIRGEVEQVYPAGRIADAEFAAERIVDLELTSIHSSASFPSGDEVTVVFPLPVQDRVIGHVAIGVSRRLEPTQRRLVLTATALLSLDSEQRQRADAAHEAHLTDVTFLLDMGHVDAARRLASQLGLPPIEDSARVMTVRSDRPASIVESIRRWSPKALPNLLHGDILWFVLPDAQFTPNDLVSALHEADIQATAVVSDFIATTTIHDTRLGLLRELDSLDSGDIKIPTPFNRTADAEFSVLQDLREQGRNDLLSALAAYLRHHRQWDRAAQDLGVHRNTLRNRMTACRKVTGLDLDNPDAAARIWLYLRQMGLA